MNKHQSAFIFICVLSLCGVFYWMTLSTTFSENRKSLEIEYILNNGLTIVDGPVLASPHITLPVNDIQELCAVAHNVNSTIIYHVRSSIEAYFWRVFNEDYSICWKLTAGRKVS